MTLRTLAGKRVTILGMAAAILGLVAMLSLLATGAFGQASADEDNGSRAGGAATASGAPGDGNGISTATSSGPSAPAGPVVPGGLWYEFSFAGTGTFVMGCSPADPSGFGCSPSSGGNSVFADAPPWTFTLGSGGGTLTVTDAFLNGDVFEVRDFGAFIGTTPFVVASGFCGDDPVVCLADPAASHGMFPLAPGAHEIKIVVASSPFGAGAAYFRVDELTPPPTGGAFVYSVKIVCAPELGPAKPALVPGMYRTAVNVHNPTDWDAIIEKWITLSPPQGQQSISGNPIREVLNPWSAFDVDCIHMKNNFGLPAGATVPGGKGFMVIRSSQELDVVAVYTSMTKTLNGVGHSMDVEYIMPKMWEPVH